MYEQLTAYEVLQSEQVQELNSGYTLLRHKKTGARVVALSNQDANKVFYIGFRTPPEDSTGVAHIIEHTVLCGSRKYPVKDPFIELAKGSLNTFLNAMTYPDKTMYPVASCNDKDFKNLMDVYLDAVFHPNIYHEEKIFKQEGWHYEMENLEDDLTINGVVYNEMKGAFSSPDDVLDREIMNSLYPDTCYGVESGGDPDVIPSLTYEQFLAFHSKYYHPSNSYIYLYGDMDMEEKLSYIDREYLSAYDCLDIDSTIGLQPSFEGMKKIYKQYSIMENESLHNNTYLTYNVAMADNLDPEKYIAYQILDYAICSAPGAPLKQALIDAQIGVDVYSNYENGIRQPFFSIVSKGANEEDLEQFVEIIESKLTELATDGINPKALQAALNYYEFKHREADFGSYPKGLMWGLQIMDSWLYDDEQPLMHLQVNHIYEKLRKNLTTDYYQKLIREGLLENAHKTIMVLRPEKGLTQKKDKALAEELEALKMSMTEAELTNIVENTLALKQYQEMEDAPEDLEKIPVLSREDIGKKAVDYVNEERFVEDRLVLHHNLFTNGVAYLRFIFDLKMVPQELYPYLGLLKAFIGLMDTKNYGYGDLFHEMHICTGGISPAVNTYIDARDIKTFQTTFEIKAKTFYDQIGKTCELVNEMLVHTDFSSDKRLKELIEETKAHAQSHMVSAGHSTAALRAMSYTSQTAYVNGLVSGIPFYEMLEDLSEHFEERKEMLKQNLSSLCRYIFRKDTLMYDITADEDGFLELQKYIGVFEEALFDTEAAVQQITFDLEQKNEGLMTASQVQYVCRAGDFRDKGLAYTGALKVLKVMFGFDYLWNQVRVKGGAYGCMCAFGKSGESYFVSYRDPNLEQTIKIYEEAADYIKAFHADERTMTQFIIGAISELDIPMTPAAKGVYSLAGYMTHYPFSMVQKERDEILATDEETIRSLAAYIEAFMETGSLCVVGGEEMIQNNGKLFKETKELFH